MAIHGCLLTQSSADNRYRELLIVGVFFLGVAFIISIDSQMELAVRDGVRRVWTKGYAEYVRYAVNSTCRIGRPHWSGRRVWGFSASQRFRCVLTRSWLMSRWTPFATSPRSGIRVSQRDRVDSVSLRVFSRLQADGSVPSKRPEKCGGQLEFSVSFRLSLRYGEGSVAVEKFEVTLDTSPKLRVPVNSADHVCDTGGTLFVSWWCCLSHTSESKALTKAASRQDLRSGIRF